MTENRGVRVGKCPIGQESTVTRPATGARVTDVASKASVAGRYQNSKKERR